MLRHLVILPIIIMPSVLYKFIKGVKFIWFSNKKEIVARVYEHPVEYAPGAKNYLT